MTSTNRLNDLEVKLALLEAEIEIVATAMSEMENEYAKLVDKSLQLRRQIETFINYEKE